jgi:hypothetical protein
MMCPTTLAARLALGLAFAGGEVAVFGAPFVFALGTSGHAVCGASLAAMRSGSGGDMGAEKRRTVSTRGASMVELVAATLCKCPTRNDLL